MTSDLPAALLPDSPGTYLLIVRLDTPVTLTVGRLGTFDLLPGLYAYAGSARGAGGLRARIGRHLRKEKPLHWHIDYLTARASIVEVWLRESPERLECGWAALLRGTEGVGEPIPGFGASDCACLTHLFVIPPERLSAAWEAVGRPRRLRVAEEKAP